MPTFRCARFPSGLAHVSTTAGLVEFRDGLALVEDPALVTALRQVPAVFGLTDDGPADPEPEPQPPPVSASKAAWVAYAVAQGWDPAVAQATTKADLTEKLAPPPGAAGADQSPDDG